MPSIYGTILGEDPVVAAQSAARTRLEEERRKQQAQFKNLLAGLPQEVQQGAVTGEAFGTLAKLAVDKWKGRDAQAEAVESSPEVAAARQNIEFAKQVQGIKADPASSQWALEVAALGKQAGREDVTLQYLGLAAERRKTESKLAADIKEKEMDNLRSAVNGLGNGGRASWIVNNPEQAKEMYSLNDKQYAALAKDAAAERDTIIAKNAAELRKLGEGVKVDTTDADTKQVLQQLSGLGLNESAFKTGWFGTDVRSKVSGEDAFTAFGGRLAQEAKAEQALAAKQGESRTIAEITVDMVKGLQEAGHLVPNEELNAANITQYFADRRATYTKNVPTVPKVPVPVPGAQETPETPTVTPDFDFTK